MLRANVIDEKDSYVIELDVPGVKGKHVNASVTARTLTVTVNFGDRAGSGDRLSGDQTRFFYLPENVKPTSCSATLDAGVLSLSFSRNAGPKTHKIEIETK
jgi:HSP20 family molecular chaperone IbpA